MSDSDRDRRKDDAQRDRIGVLARSLRAWQVGLNTSISDWKKTVDTWRGDVDQWRQDVDRRLTRRSFLVLIALVAFMLGFVAVGGATRELYRRSTDRAQESSRIVQQFQDSREQNALAACEDRNEDRRQLRGLGRDLGGARLERAVGRRFPLVPDCDKYAHDSVTTGRQPQGTPEPTASPTP